MNDKDNKEQKPVNAPAKSEAGGRGQKKRWVLPVILIFAGLIMALSPFIGRLYNHWQERQLLSSFADEDDQENNLDSAQALIDLSLLEDEEVLPEEKGLKAVAPTYKPTIIGSITIPKLNLVRPIANDVTRGDLRVAIGKMPGSSNIGQAGNISLVGHRNYAYKVFFDDLDKLAPGDLIILESNKGKFTYEIYESEVIEADDNSVMAIRKSEYIVTLITCHPKYINDKRLVYKGRLVDPLPEEEPDPKGEENPEKENPEEEIIQEEKPKPDQEKEPESEIEDLPQGEERQAS